MEKKFFTLEEANQFLPYLSRQLEIVQHKKAEILGLIRNLDKIGVNVEDIMGRSTGLNEEENRYRVNLEHLGDEINHILQDIQDLGCLVKDIDQGLIDFWGRLNGEDVFLCWKLGESEVSHWHRSDEGFANRKSLFQRQILEDLGKLH